jgi:cation diffusion facilitator family transporter
MIIATGLIVTGIGLAVQCVREIVTPHHAPRPFTLVVLALVVITKELLYRRLARVGREVESTSIHVDAWHHRSDALTSAAAFVGITIAIAGGEGFESADDWAALFACAIIVTNGARLLGSAIAEVMDSAAPARVEEGIRVTAEARPGVIAVEKCFARKSGPGWLVDIHVEVDGSLSVIEGHQIGHDVKAALRASPLGILDVLVHIEPADRTKRAASEELSVAVSENATRAAIDKN